jgi:hypothetical protein
MLTVPWSHYLRLQGLQSTSSKTRGHKTPGQHLAMCPILSVYQHLPGTTLYAKYLYVCAGGGPAAAGECCHSCAG